jgi:hypothetical protein
VDIGDAAVVKVDGLATAASVTECSLERRRASFAHQPGMPEALRRLVKEDRMIDEQRQGGTPRKLSDGSRQATAGLTCHRVLSGRPARWHSLWTAI